MGKYKNPVNTKEYHVEVQRKYEKRKLAERQKPIWVAMLERVMNLQAQGINRYKIADQVTKDEKFLIKERVTK
jgi:hypothetical protein